MRICLFEDQGAADLEPLSLTRPVFDLWCGLRPIADKLVAALTPDEIGLLVRPFLADVCREQRGGMPVNDLEWLRSEPTVMVNGRWLPPAEFHRSSLHEPCIGTVDGTVAFAAVTGQLLEDFTLQNLDDLLEEWKHTIRRIDAGGKIVSRPWDLVAVNAEQIVADFRSLRPAYAGEEAREIGLIGPGDRLRVASSALIEPFVVADTRGGPIVVDRNAIIGAFTRLEGPCFVGPGAQVLGAKIRSGTTLGPNCRVGGEVEASIVHGHSNKYHDGFLGHSYVGEWVNIGAGAQTSDLRHDYGEVLVASGGMRVPTGSTKVGSFIGDHAKIGLGSLLNSGTMIGAFAGVLPAGKLLPKSVPSFCAVLHGEVADNEDIDVLFSTAEEVMRRRGVRLTLARTTLYRALYEQTAQQRKQAIRDNGPRRLRRSA